MSLIKENPRFFFRLSLFVCFILLYIVLYYSVHVIAGWIFDFIFELDIMYGLKKEKYILNRTIQSKMYGLRTRGQRLNRPSGLCI